MDIMDPTMLNRAITESFEPFKSGDKDIHGQPCTPMEFCTIQKIISQKIKSYFPSQSFEGVDKYLTAKQRLGRHPMLHDNKQRFIMQINKVRKVYTYYMIKEKDR